MEYSAEHYKEIERILLNQLGAKKTDFLWNVIDTAICTYDLKGVEIEIIIREEYWDDIIGITCADKSILETIRKLHANSSAS